MPYYLSIERNDHMHTPPPNTHHTHTHTGVSLKTKEIQLCFNFQSAVVFLYTLFYNTKLPHMTSLFNQDTFSKPTWLKTSYEL